VARLLEVLSDLLENKTDGDAVSLTGEGRSGSGRLLLDKDGLVNKIASPQKSASRPVSMALTLSVEQWQALVTHFKDPILGVPVRDRTMRLRNYPCCFVGSQAIDWLLVHKCVAASSYCCCSSYSSCSPCLDTQRAAKKL
jgi:hypothetical protein